MRSIFYIYFKIILHIIQFEIMDQELQQNFQQIKDRNNRFRSSQYQFVMKSQSSELSYSTEHKYLIPHPNNDSKTNNISIYKQQYQQYFRDIEQQVRQKIIQCLQNTTRKFEHKIVLLKQASEIGKMISFEKPSIYHTGSLHNGSLMLYEAIIGNYKLAIDLLNLPIEAPKKVKQIGSGTYGSIYLIPYYQKQIVVAKRIIFNYQQNIEDLYDKKWRIRPNPHELHEAISEYCIYKISSFYKIGPCTVHNLGFDLICFNNCVEFYMEPCIQLSCNYMNLQEDIKISTRLLHELHIIHKDIKPSNILFSPTYERFVLVDYGISHPIKENIGQLSLTYRQGSPSFMSKQMRQIKHGESQYINLYYNDLFGLKQSLEQFKKYSELKKLKVSSSLMNISANLQYLEIYLLGILLRRNKKKLSQFVTSLNFKPYFIKSKIFDQFSNIFNIKNQLFQDLSLDLSIIQITQTKPSLLLEVQFLIRCHGLSKKLQYYLNKLQQTPLIINIKDQIIDIKWNPIISEKSQKFLEFNQNEFIIKRCIQKLQSIGHQDSSTQQTLFIYLVKLYVLIINKPAQFINQMYQVLKKIEINIKTQKQQIEYQICELMLYCKIQLNILNCKFIMRGLIKKYPKYKIQILKFILLIIIQNDFMIECQLQCLKEYFKQESKYRIQILRNLNRVASYYYRNGQKAKSLWYLNQQKKKIQIYKTIKYQNQQQYNQLIYQQLNYSANIQEVLGNFQMALHYYKQYLQKQLEQYGLRSKKIISSYYFMGLCCIQVNRFEQAQSNLLKVIQIFQFYSKDYLYDNFYQCCKLQLIIVYINMDKVQKIQDLIKNLFFRELDKNINQKENMNKDINYIQQLKIKIKSKTNKLIIEFSSNNERNIIVNFLIFKSQCHNYFKQLTYISRIHQQIQKSNAKTQILSIITNYMLIYKQQLAIHLNLIIQKYIILNKRYQLFNQIIADFVSIYIKVIPIDRNQATQLVQYLYQQEVQINKNSILCICYLKFQFCFLQRKYSYKFINCTNRLSVYLFRGGYKQQCIYYSTRLLVILMNTQCEQKSKMYQLYKRIIDCHVGRGKWKKLEIMKIKEMKNLNKRILSITEYSKFYLRILRLNYLVILKSYIRYVLKQQPKIKLSNHIQFKIRNQSKIFITVFEQKNELQSQLQKFKLITLMKQYEYLRVKLGVLKSIKSISVQIDKNIKILR